LLKYPHRRFKWSGKAQAGFFIDFVLKKLVDVFVRNVFIFGALFFGEKYMIEYITKRIVDNLIFVSNKRLGFTNLNYGTFFITFVGLLFYVLGFLNLLVLFS